MTQNAKKLDELFERLVPGEGEADTVAGEIVRATSRIGYRFFNDGDHIGVGYGNETCNAPARYLMDKCEGPVARTVSSLWGEYDEQEYGDTLDKLFENVVTYLEEHPELETTENTENLWDWRDPNADVDDSYDEEDEYWEDNYDEENYNDEEDYDDEEGLELSEEDLNFDDENGQEL